MITKYGTIEITKDSIGNGIIKIRDFEGDCSPNSLSYQTMLWALGALKNEMSKCNDY